jgi:DNA-binding MarR family transcriptional regulator
MLKGEQELEKVPYGEQLYRILFQIVGNKKNASLIESLRGENAVLTWLVRQEEDVHPGDLAEKLSLVPGRMTDILKTLEKKGMIRRERDPEDRRRVLVRITPKGARSVTERREQIRVQYSGLYEALGLDDTVKLIELLHKVNRYFDEM